MPETGESVRLNVRRLAVRLRARVVEGRGSQGRNDQVEGNGWEGRRNLTERRRTVVERRQGTPSRTMTRDPSHVPLPEEEEPETLNQRFQRVLALVGEVFDTESQSRKGKGKRKDSGDEVE